MPPKFVGSLDCGTTYAVAKASTEPVAYHLSDQPVSWSSTVMPTSWLSTRSNFPSIILNLGESSSNHTVTYGRTQRYRRWHEQDPNQIIQACHDCINEAVTIVEAAGYPKSSIEIMGTSGVYSDSAGKWINGYRDHEST